MIYIEESIDVPQVVPSSEKNWTKEIKVQFKWSYPLKLGWLRFVSFNEEFLGYLR